MGTGTFSEIGVFVWVPLKVGTELGLTVSRVYWGGVISRDSKWSGGAWGSCLIEMYVCSDCGKTHWREKLMDQKF